MITSFPASRSGLGGWSVLWVLFPGPFAWCGGIDFWRLAGAALSGRQGEDLGKDSRISWRRAQSEHPGSAHAGPGRVRESTESTLHDHRPETRIGDRVACSSDRSLSSRPARAGRAVLRGDKEEGVPSGEDEVRQAWGREERPRSRSRLRHAICPAKQSL